MGRTVFLVETSNGVASCLMYNESAAVLKEFNFCRDYETKHLPNYSNLIRENNELK